MGNIKKFEDFLDKMRGLLDNAKKQGHIIVRVEDIENTFPELKESEDGKIRKAILALVKQSSEVLDKQNQNNMIAWLEKQGEKPQGKSALEAIKEEKVDNANKVEPKDYSSIDPHFFKTTDKVESKFKVGDFIVNDYCSGKVIKITDDAFLLDTGQGIPFSCEHNAHLWNVTKDAKAGDTLVCKGNIKGSNEVNYERICLFNNLDKAFFTLTRAHYGVDVFDIDVNIDYPDNTVPATKEQKEILFMVMKNAGYTFDFKKKKLKKLGQSEVTKMSDQEEIAEIPFGAKDSELQEATYYIPKGFHAEIDDDKVVIKKGEKPAAWSKEDEQIILNIELI